MQIFVTEVTINYELVMPLLIPTANQWMCLYLLITNIQPYFNLLHQFFQEVLCLNQEEVLGDEMEDKRSY